MVSFYGISGLKPYTFILIRLSTKTYSEYSVTACCWNRRSICAFWSLAADEDEEEEADFQVNEE